MHLLPSRGNEHPTLVVTFPYRLLMSRIAGLGTHQEQGHMDVHRFGEHGDEGLVLLAVLGTSHQLKGPTIETNHRVHIDKLLLRVDAHSRQVELLEGISSLFDRRGLGVLGLGSHHA